MQLVIPREQAAILTNHKGAVCYLVAILNRERADMDDDTQFFGERAEGCQHRIFRLGANGSQ